MNRTRLEWTSKLLILPILKEFYLKIYLFHIKLGMKPFQEAEIFHCTKKHPSAHKNVISPDFHFNPFENEENFPLAHLKCILSETNNIYIPRHRQPRHKKIFQNKNYQPGWVSKKKRNT